MHAGGPGQRPLLPAGEVAGALQAFVAGQPVRSVAVAGNGRRPVEQDLSSDSGAAPGAWTAVSAAAGRRPPADVPGAAPSAAVPRLGAAGGAPSRAAAIRNLADDVAEIVREQAISHGIDVP